MPVLILILRLICLIPLMGFSSSPPNADAEIESDPLTEEYSVDEPEFDPSLDEHPSDSLPIKHKETKPTKKTSTSATTSAQASNSQQAKESASSTGGSQNEKAATATSTETATANTEKEQASVSERQPEQASGAKELSDADLARQRISGAGGLPPLREDSGGNKEKPRPTPGTQEEAQKQGTYGQLEKGPHAGQHRGDDPIDTSDHAHQRAGDEHIHGDEGDGAGFGSHQIKWNLQRPVKTAKSEAEK